MLARMKDVKVVANIAMLIEEFTPQPYKPINRISPTGLDLELLSWPPKTPPKVLVAQSPEGPSIRAL